MDFGQLQTERNIMPLPQTNITPSTAMGANLVAGGATFKVWGPSARAVCLNGTFGGSARWTANTSADLLLSKDANGYWTGFLAGVVDGDQYKFYVVGPPGGTTGYKRDPYARELTPSSIFPFGVNCVVRAGGSYPWHDQAFVTPDYSNLILYQLHVGTFAPSAFPQCGTFLDVITKIPYLVSLGINLLQPLPIMECKEKPDMGYDGADLFSPDSLYAVNNPADLPPYLATINGLLAAKGLPALTAGQITSQANQLKAMMDLCHVYGIAVNFDVIYNHAGGFDGDDEAIFFWDRLAMGDNNNSLYFTNVGMAGGLAFALGKNEVRQFLIDNASFFLNEFHVDGFRYDEISKLLADTYYDSSGWDFCRALTSTVRYIKPRALQNAEFWPSEYDKGSYGSMVQPAIQGGTGFDTVQHDALRCAIRRAVEAASYGQSSAVNMDAIRDSLYPPGLPQAWNAVPCVENHDTVYSGRENRVPRLADGSNSRSFYAASRSKVATGLLLASPGIPQLFMGQEFLEDKQWNENPAGSNLIYWTGLDSGDKAMSDQLRFTQDFIRLRWSQPALRGQNINAYNAHNDNRIVAFHRWIEGQGLDVLVVASFNDNPFFNYQLGFPRGGRWAELFNSDVYQNWVNPLMVGNNGAIFANGGPMNNLPFSASITIPPRSILVFGAG
jgi:1,4-alpha-glucan branching enzyme